MSFYPRRRRSPPAIIIISLIDVLIVMLTFLLVTTSFRNQPSVRVNLPDVGDTTVVGATRAKPPIIVTVAAEAPYFHLGTFAVTEERLERELRDAAARDPQIELVIRADAEVNWHRVAKVLFFGQQAQIQKMRAVTKAGAGTAIR